MIKVIVNGALGKMGKVLTRCVKEDKDLELVCGASLPTGETTDYKLSQINRNNLFKQI